VVFKFALFGTARTRASPISTHDFHFPASA